MTKPMIAIFDVQTQQETIREMNDEEYAQHLKDKVRWDSEETERLAKEQQAAAAKAAVEAKLAALGLDLDTVKAIAKLG